MSWLFNVLNFNHFNYFFHSINLSQISVETWNKKACKIIFLFDDHGALKLSLNKLHLPAFSTEFFEFLAIFNCFKCFLYVTWELHRQITFQLKTFKAFRYALETTTLKLQLATWNKFESCEDIIKVTPTVTRCFKLFIWKFLTPFFPFEDEFFKGFSLHKKKSHLVSCSLYF